MQHILLIVGNKDAFGFGSHACSGSQGGGV